MPPRKLSDLLAELAECRDLVRVVKRHAYDADRQTLYEVDAKLGHVTAALKATDAAWEEDQPSEAEIQEALRFGKTS